MTKAVSQAFYRFPKLQLEITYPPATRCTALFAFVCDAIIRGHLDKQLINSRLHHASQKTVTMTNQLTFTLGIAESHGWALCVSADWILIGQEVCHVAVANISVK